MKSYFNSIHIWIIVLMFAGSISICSFALKAEGSQVMHNEDNPDASKNMQISLTFQKSDAEQAMNFYVSIFDNARIIDVQRWSEGGPGKEGTIMMARFELNGMKFICSDSPPVHNWDFTPAVSIYVECNSEEEIEKLFIKLSENGTAAMPLGNYGFSQKFGWVIDQFGVSWQLNLQ